MSFGQGGPLWGDGNGQGQGPYGGDQNGGGNPYGAPQGPFPGQDPYAGQGQFPGRGGYQGQGQGPFAGQGPGPDGQNPYGAAPFGPTAGPPHDPGTPDWDALADRSQSRTRRRRWLLIGGGAVATCAIAAIVAAAVVSTSGGSGSTRAAGHGGSSASSGHGSQVVPGGSTPPEPSFSSVAPAPPPDPEQYVGSAAKDTAPLSTATLFPGENVAFGPRVYDKAATATTSSCASAVQGTLGATLASHGCTEFFRATYHKAGVAVTIGIAVFDSQAQAAAANNQVDSGIASLAGGGVPVFCRDGVVCRRTNNTYGRYVYFTIGGYTSGQNTTSKSTDVFTAGNDLAQFTVSELVSRGKAEASAAAGTPAA